MRIGFSRCRKVSGVRIKQVNVREMYELFCQDKQNYLLYMGVCIK